MPQQQTEERAIATMMMAVLDWVMDANEHIQRHIPANEGYSLEMLAKMEMARAESHQLIELSEQLGALYDKGFREGKHAKKGKELFRQFFEALERCTDAFTELYPYFPRPVPMIEDRQVQMIIREQSERYK